MPDEMVLLWMPIATAVIGLLAICLATRFRRGELISPFSTSLLILVAIFGVRPILMFANSSYWFYGLDVSDGFSHASLIGLCGVAAMSLGYFMSRHTLRDGAPLVAPATQRLNSERGSGLGQSIAAAGAILAGWFVLTAYIGGGVSFIAATFEGRSAEIGIVYAGVPAGVPALPVAAGITVAFGRIVISRVRPIHLREELGYWTIIVLAVIPPAALGSRRFLIPTVVAALTGALYRSWKRRVTIVMVIGASAAAFLLAVVPYVRSAGSRTDGEGLIGSAADHIGATGIAGVLNDFFLSYDTEMFSYVAYVVPRLGFNASDIPYGLGRGTLLELALAPLPSSLLPVQSWSNSLLTSIFGGACGTVNCPVPSAFGTLYFDWSFPGLVVGGAAAGMVFARYGHWIKSAAGAKLASLLLVGSFAPLMARGNMVSQAWIAVQVLLVVLIVLVLIRVWSRIDVRLALGVNELRRTRPNVASELASEEEVNGKIHAAVSATPE